MKRALGLGVALTAGIVAMAAPSQAETLRLGAAVASNRAIEFEVILPLHNEAGLDALLAAQQDPNSHYYHQWLTPASFAAQFGPDAATKQKAADSLNKFGLSVTIRSRSLHVSGTVAEVDRALGTSLVDGVSLAGHHYLVATTAFSLPQAALDAGGEVLDFARNVRTMHVDSKRMPGAVFAIDAPLNRTSATGGYFFDDLKQAYSYPSYQTMVTVGGVTKRLDGTGATIGILMSSDIYASDIAAMFNHEKFSTYAGVANPTLYAKVKVAGGSTTSSDALDEASLDTQQAIGGAPGAHVILYEIPSLSDTDIEDGYIAINEANVADVVSSSFGGCELLASAAYSGVDAPVEKAYMELEHEEFAQGNSQGISFLASSGDSAGLACPSAAYFNGSTGKFVASVENPADDTDVTAVGGGNLITSYTSGSLASSYVGENAWSDPEIAYDPYDLGKNVTGGSFGAGGGLSAGFARPAYQDLVTTGSTTARALPDVGMQVGGCPGSISETPCDGGDRSIDGSGNAQRSYVYVAVDGQLVGLIGTSVASPEFAGATALLVEVKGRQGNLNSFLYSAAAKQATAGGLASQATTLFNTGIAGYNGVVANGAASSNYNYTYGLGSPVVYRYAGVPTAALAGVPETSSNP